MVIIYADARERGSRIIPILKKKCDVKEKQLDVADYLLSDKAACERKTSSDFSNSIIDGRLFKQLSKMTQTYDKPFIIIEGDYIYRENMHPNAIRGALAAIALSFRVPILWTRTQKETADMLFTIGKREQVKKKRNIRVRNHQKPRSENEQQEIIIAGLPGVSTKLAERLLEHFNQPEKIFTATQEELTKVEGIGTKKASKIKKIIIRAYEKSILK